VSKHSHHSHATTGSSSGKDRNSLYYLRDTGSNATISNLGINPQNFQCSYYTAESENSYCSISGENQTTQIQQRPPQKVPDEIEAEDSNNDSISASIMDSSDSQQQNEENSSVDAQPGADYGSKKHLVLTPSKITIENIGQLAEMQSAGYDLDDLDIRIPEYFNSPSKIKWNFLAGLEETKSYKSSISSLGDAEEGSDPGTGVKRRETTSTDTVTTDEPDGGHTAGPTRSSSCKIEELLKKSSPSASNADVKTVSIWRAGGNDDEANAIIFHHESEIVENCCTNHFLANSSYDICTIENCDYLINNLHHDKQRLLEQSKNNLAKNGGRSKSEEQLNNVCSKSASSTCNKLELKQRNIFTSATTSTTNTSHLYSHLVSPDLRRYEKQTNVDRNSVNLSHNLQSPSPSSSSTTSSMFLGEYICENFCLIVRYLTLSHPALHICDMEKVPCPMASMTDFLYSCL
jgi:hypothetical protein